MSDTMEMPRYKSHKTVWALKIDTVVSLGTDTTTDENPIVEVHFEDQRHAPRRINLHGKPTPESGWYLVQYADGYVSFSPAQQFEEGNMLEESLPSMVLGIGIGLARGFGWAIKEMHNGMKVRRAGWNGKGMFLFLVPGSTFKVNRPPLLGIYPEGTEINYHAHIDMKTANDQVVPWLASQTDMLAFDWEPAD